MGKRAIDLTGQRFGRYTVLERAGSDTYRASMWHCRCDCGTERIVRGKNLKSGAIVSCGCYQRAVVKDMFTTHNGSKTRLYFVWDGMIGRCYRKKSAHYKDYGGRGITICDEWRHSFETFRDWAMANGYDETAPRGQCTIDRIDANGNYEPSNCRWVTQKEQNGNKRQRGART